MLIILWLIEQLEPNTLFVDCPECNGYRHLPNTHEPCAHCQGKGGFVSVVDIFGVDLMYPL